MVEIEINGSVVRRLGTLFSSLEITDETGAQADTLTLCIPGEWRRPQGDDKIRVNIG